MREYAGQRAPALGRIAQPEIFGHLAGHAAPYEVVHRPVGGLEFFAVGGVGFFQHIAQRLLPLALRRRPRPVLGRGVFLGHLHAVLLRQFFDRVHKPHARKIHQKADHIAVLAAAKAVVELFGRAHRERGRLLPVKRTQPHEVGPALLELHMPPHDVHHVRARDEFLNKSGGDGHAGIVGRGFGGQEARRLVYSPDDQLD